MKKNYLRSFALAAIVMLGAGALAQNTTVATSTSDGWIRTANGGASNNGEAVEMKTFTKEDLTTQNFYGVMTFDLTQPDAGNEVASATLRLTTRYAKGKRGVTVYALPEAVDGDGAKYNDLSDAIEAAMATAPIAQFNVKSDGTKAIFDKGVKEEYQNVAAWQNTIDLTAYVRTVKAGSFSILLVKDAEENSSTQIYSKDYKEVTWHSELGTDVAGTVIPENEIVPQLTVEYHEATGVIAKTLLPVADTQVRKDASGDYSANGNFEVYTYKDDEAEKDLDFVGLMAFQLPAELQNAENYELQSATLRLVSKRVKGDRNIDIFALGSDFAENATYADIETALTEARATTAIAQFAAAGQGNKDFEIDGIGEDWRTADKWTNNIDLTDYLKTLTAGRLNIAICANANANSQKMFFTKEATGFTNEKDEENGAFTIVAEDLVPQLTIVCKEKGTNTITEIKVAPVTRGEGIYTIDGRRVSNPVKGLYIVNGKKVVLN